jgi:hypothetical protein
LETVHQTEDTTALQISILSKGIKVLVIGIYKALSLGPETTLSKAGGSSNAGGASHEVDETPCP